MIRLQYFKWHFLWNSVIGNKYKKYYIENPLFNPEFSNNKLSLSDINGGKIMGFRLLRRPFNLFNRYSLEYGEWDIFSYIADWIHFCSYSQVNSVEASRILEKNIIKFSKNNNQSVSDIIDNLWNEIWILDNSTFADLKYKLIWNNIPPSNKSISDLYEDIYNKICDAKNVKDLNGWISNLYLIFPEVQYARKITLTEKEEDIRSYNRFFEEISADIWAVFLSFTFSAIHNMPELIYTSIKEQILKDVSSKDEILKSIKYESKSRVVMPYFWFQKASEWILGLESNNLQSDLRSLNSFDDRMAVGNFCQLSLYHKKLWLNFLLAGEFSKKDSKEIFIKE